MAIDISNISELRPELRALSPRAPSGAVMKHQREINPSLPSIASACLLSRPKVPHVASPLPHIRPLKPEEAYGFVSERECIPGS